MTIRYFASILALLVSAPLLGGCITDDPDLVTLRNQSRWSQSVHYIDYLPGQSTLSPQESTRLDNFLARTSANRGETVVVMVSEKDRLLGIDVAAKRAQSLIDTLARRNVRVRYVARVPGRRLRDKAAISVGQITAGRPVCHDWDRVRLGGEMTGTRNTFGCVIDSALYDQIQRKQDLVRGRKLGPASGTNAARTIDDYNSGKLPPVSFPKPTAPYSTTSGTE